MVNVMGVESVLEDVLKVLPEAVALDMLKNLFTNVKVYASEAITHWWITDESYENAAMSLKNIGYEYVPDDIYSIDEMDYAALVEIESMSLSAGTVKARIIIYQKEKQ